MFKSVVNIFALKLKLSDCLRKVNVQEHKLTERVFVDLKHFYAFTCRIKKYRSHNRITLSYLSDNYNITRIVRPAMFSGAGKGRDVRLF